MADGRGGRRPNTGGARPGSGRKPKEVRVWQESNLLMLRAAITPADVVVIAESLRDALKTGDKDAWRQGLAYIFGASPKEVTIAGDDGSPLKLVVEIAHVDGAKKS